MRDCPDLTGLSPREKEEFWKDLDPRQLKSLGDRLMAESLPHVELSRSREELANNSYLARERLGWSRKQVCDVLGVTTEMLSAWEEDRVKAPECLPFVLDRLRELETGDQSVT